MAEVPQSPRSGEELGSDAGEDMEMDADVYRVKLEKVDGKFGIAYRAEVFGLVVTGIAPGYGVDQWNHVADADRMLCVGDIIVAVNEIEVAADARKIEDSKCLAMVNAMADAEGVTSFTLLKYGPRWHVTGVVAECMEKMHMAAEMGVHLEAVSADAAVVDDDYINESEMKGLSGFQTLMIAIMVALPNMFLLVLWSSMGAGHSLFNLLSDPQANQAGNALIAVASAVMVGMFLVDWNKWDKPWQKFCVAVLVVYAIALGSIAKCKFYPQAPMVVTLFHLPIFIGILRGTSLKQVNRSSFYRGIGWLTLTAGLIILLLWLLWIFVPSWDGTNKYDDKTKAKLIQRSAPLYDSFTLKIGEKGKQQTRSLNYDWDCNAKNVTDFKMVYGKPVGIDYKLTKDEKKTRAAACSSVKTIWFLLWVCPFIAVLINLIVAGFCLVNGTMLETNDISKAERALTRFILMVMILLLGMWVAASMAGPSMKLTGTLMAFCAAGLVVLFVWMYFEVGARLISSAIRQSKIMGILVFIVTADAFRALCVTISGMLIPVMFALEALRQKVRRLRKSTPHNTWLTPETNNIVQQLRNWRFVTIAINVNVWVIIIWIVMIGVAKITYVFLAWLNAVLTANMSFVMLVIIFWIIGFCMFLLPPVPGAPMYVVCGLIVCNQARNLPAVGYGWGIVIASAMAFTMKLLAGFAVNVLGIFMGKSTKIMQFCQVDTVPIRAVERILLQPGMGMGKVAILIGGPDWPVGILCGVLRLSLIQMLIGSLPVFFVTTPCVVAGAFLTGPKANMNEAEKSLWDALANTAVALAGFVQLAAGGLAFWYMHQEISKHGEELAKHRPEHDKVLALTQAEQAYNDCFQEVCNHKELSWFWNIFLFTSTFFFLLSGNIFFFLDNACWESFSVTDSISDPEGLACGQFDLGCALINIVRRDGIAIGWIGLALFFIGCAMHTIVINYLKWRASKRLKMKQSIQAKELAVTDA